jgi:hypothetical protein
MQLTVTNKIDRVLEKDSVFRFIENKSLGWRKYTKENN